MIEDGHTALLGLEDGEVAEDLGEPGIVLGYRLRIS
jgi:hypothetical protein